MTRQEILDQLTEIFQDVLDVDDLVVTDALKADDVDEWDSLSHIQLIVAIEKQWHIKFNSREIMSWQNVGEMVDTIAQRIVQ
ncbi:MAG: acyl carrier protein [Muribaculaceae bacterium]|nr:acyl carrier protein [Muribaculaceae bacterium]